MIPQQCYRALLIEEDAEDVRKIAALIEALPSGGFQLADVAETVEQALPILKQGGIDLVLLDTGGCQSLQAVRKVAGHLPVIVLTGEHDEWLALAVVQEGAQDCLLKEDLTPRFLLHAMRCAIQRERAEQALARQQEFLEAMLKTSPDRIYFKDQQSRFLRINQSLAHVFGLDDPDDALGKTDFDFFPPELAKQKFEDEQQILITGEAVVDKLDLEMPKQGGKEVWLLTTKMPLRDRKGEVIGTFGLSRDITVIKEMKDALSHERNLLRSVIDNVPASIHAKNKEGKYILTNAAHLKLLKIQSPDGILDKTVFDLFPPELAGAYDADDQAVIQSGTSIIDKVEPSLSHSGRPCWISTTKVPLTGEDGAITGLVCVGRDITEQKIAREQLEEANRDLTKSREDLMRALAELREVQLRLIEAEKMKLVGRLAAGVAHEVKNPLAIIAMGMDYLEQQPFEDSNVAIILQEIRDAVSRADSVIRGLLDFSAPSKLQRVEVNLNTIIRQALILVRGELCAGKFEVVEELDPNLPLVSVDALKIEQAFVNVLTNAIHAMGEKGTLVIRTSCRQLTGVGENISKSDAFRLGDHLIATEILDDGPGLAVESINKIFEPFFTTKPTGKGTGLGLTVTKTIIDLHGGTIEIRNRAEGGVGVSIMLKACYPL